MLTLDDFDYPLPPERIAQMPLAERSASRLLVMHGATLEDRVIRDLPDLLQPGDLLVMNDTRVIHARLYGRKDTGGQVEVLVERIAADGEVIAQLRASKPPKLGSRLLLEESIDVEVLGRIGEFWRLTFAGDAIELIERHGRLPLPPYIEHPATTADEERYLAEHRMHKERYTVPQATVDAIAACRARGGRVVAVGTTSLRTLETAALDSELKAGSGESELFVTPGFDFKVVDVLLTNFHLPKSTLLMLVSAFGGLEEIRAAYRHAIAHNYRFFSYGDAMLIHRAP